MEKHYPIESGAIWSPDVGKHLLVLNSIATRVSFMPTLGFYSVIFRNADMDPLEKWKTLPVCSIPPIRNPKVTENGTRYSFEMEQEVVKERLRSGLRICAAANCTHVVIGDFGLGNSFLNPPTELAKLWREVFLYDPGLRGRFRYVGFVFQNTVQSTTQLILDDIKKKSSGGGLTSSNPGVQTDFEIFSSVFENQEVRRVIEQRDPRGRLGHILGG